MPADPRTERPLAEAPLRVVAGILRDGEGRVLLAQRPHGKAHAGLWEFPGGKVEAGESDHDALARELDEELGIRIDASGFVRRTLWHYPARSVELISLAVPSWSGEPAPRHAQALRWIAPRGLLAAPMPEADRPTAVDLVLPREYAITPEPGHDRDAFLAGLERTLARGAGMLQLRAKTLARDDLAGLARAAVPIAARHGALLLLNGEPGLAAELGFHGVQLRAAQLAVLDSRPLDAGFLVGASCHDASGLARAEAIGADFAVLAPVLSAGSQPHGAPMGWPAFAACVGATSLPVFALGGVAPRHLELARAAGAHGVAGISGFRG